MSIPGIHVAGLPGVLKLACAYSEMLHAGLRCINHSVKLWGEEEMTDGERTKIELDALRALAGADEVRKKLLAAVSMGNPSVESSAYLIKCRVKAHDRLVEKVLDRRTSGKPNYEATDATDIVGLRILSLYRAELPGIIKHFLEFVGHTQGNPFNLFIGSKLKDSLHEVIVYRGQVSDVTDELILKEFEKVGLTSAIVPDGALPTDISADVKIIRKPSQYSSIHLVLWCTGYSQDRRFGVPLEVQIRTALEDAWGEIDHSLHYKLQQHDPRALGDQVEHYNIAIQHLKVLKGLLDNCTSTADLIYKQIGVLFTGSSYSVKPILAARSVDTDRLLTLPLPRQLKQRISAVVEDIKRLFDSIYAEGWPSDDNQVVQAIHEFERIASLLDAHFAEFKRSGIEDVNVDRDVTYYLKMERCLCLYWISYLTKTTLRGGQVADFQKKADEALEKSLKEYFELEADGRFSLDAILAFRIGNALRLRGHSELALDKYEEAAARLQKSEIPAEHAMRVRIPRHLGMAYWEMAEDTKRKAEKLNNPDLLLASRQKQYLKALAVTLPVYDISVSAHTMDHTITDKEEKRITANNILEYVVCFLKSGGDWDTLASQGITKQRAQKYLHEVVGVGLAGLNRATLADTIRAVAILFGDTELARAAARRVLELMKNRDFKASLPDVAYEEMRRDAEEMLANQEQAG